MDRLACVNVAALPLQLLLRAHPAWIDLPVAVIESDTPQAPLQFLNAAARRAGARPGHRYATALAMARDLHAGTVSAAEIAHGVRTLTDRLRQYAPHVEPSSDTPGVFWIDVQGLARHYPSLQKWADDVRTDLQNLRMTSTVVVGFSRFGVYALATAQHGTVVCADVAEEHARVRRVPLACLTLDADVRDRLLALGIETVGDFLRLPGDAIKTRFGAQADALYRLASGSRWAPLLPVPADERHETQVDFETPESHLERLIFVIKRLLDGLVLAMASRMQAVTGIVLHMKLDDRTIRRERVRPAAPTLDSVQLLALVRLRLETLQLSTPLVRLTVTAETCPATADQHRLFAEQTRRDAGRANQALARLRAECGDHSVVRARLCDAHLPAARFVWEPLDQVAVRSAARVVAVRPLVRRIYARPRPLPSNIGPPVDLTGPYVLSGAWWGGGVHREYDFGRTGDGDWWWLYYDRRRHRFFLQGCVE